MKRRKVEEHVNHERWMVSYADFITLLFAFFVVMYAISSVNEGKYRILSQSLVAAFKETPLSLDPVQIGNEIAVSPAVPEPAAKMDDDGATSKEDAAVAGLVDLLQNAFPDLVASDKISVRKSNRGIAIDISSNVLFPSGAAALTFEAQDILDELSGVLRMMPNAIQVEGFTDNQPISTLAYPSNWELSAARASAVVRWLAGVGVNPSRMIVAGYGEYTPVADNSTEAGRAKNRRVSILILSQHPFDYGKNP